MFAALMALLLLFATTPRDGRLAVTGVDQTGGVLPNATVTIGGIEDANRASVIPPAIANEQGIATFVGLRPGRYAIKAEFPAFDVKIEPDVRVRIGDNKQTLALSLQKLTDEITVS